VNHTDIDPTIIVLDDKTEDMRNVIEWFGGAGEEMKDVAVGNGVDAARSIYFLSTDGSDKERTPICPDCFSDLHIAENATEACVGFSVMLAPVFDRRLRILVPISGRISVFRSLRP